MDTTEKKTRKKPVKDQRPKRRLNLKVYPTKEQRKILHSLRHDLCGIWNLDTRYVEAGKPGGAASYKAFATVKNANKDASPYRDIDTRLVNSMLQRHKNARSTFFGLVKKNAQKNAKPPGPIHPDKFTSFDNVQVKDTGAKLVRTGNKSWKLTLTRSGNRGLGDLKCRGSVPYEDWSLASITMKWIPQTDEWYASVVVSTVPKRTASDGVMGLDLGLETLITSVHSNGTVHKVDYRPREGRTTSNAMIDVVNRAHAKVALHQRSMARRAVRDKNQKIIKKTSRYVQASRRAFVASRKMASIRRDRHHKLSAQKAAQATHLVTEELSVARMMAKGGKYKKGLNKTIARAGWSSLLKMLAYKSRETGGELSLLPTKLLAPSQTCSCCGERTKHTLSVRTWDCSHCGVEHDRDENAAQNMLQWYLALDTKERGKYSVTTVE